MPRERSSRHGRRRCLIVERHAWETGFAQEQLQIPLEAAEEFFGPGDSPRAIRIRIARAGTEEYPCRISRRYLHSRTRRLTGLYPIGLMGPCFVFLLETDRQDVYEMWCDYDMAIVAAYFSNWRQARSSQHGRGRLVTIVDAPLPRPIRELPQPMASR